MKGKYSGTLVLALLWTPVPTHAQSIFHVVPTPNGNHGTRNNGLLAVAASSPSDVWAVGQTTIHFDGTKWTAFPAPLMTGENTSQLDGVAVISPTEAWAAGLINIGLANPGQVIEQWNGTEWSVYPGPAFPAGDQPAIYSMTTVSANDIWAVGSLLTNGGELLEALFEHWDGTAWTAGIGAFHGFFRAVSADAANDIWAVGYSGETTFSEHYDGTSWTLVRTPNVGTGQNTLNGVTALAPDDVWAVGYSTASQKPPPGQYDVPTETLIEHYDGSSWSVVSSPNVGPKSQYQSNSLRGLAAVSPTDIWAFGSYFAASGSGNQGTLLLHWDGTSWSLASSPNPDPSNFLSDILFGGTVTAPGTVWIVGSEDTAAPNKPVTGTLVLYTTGG